MIKLSLHSFACLLAGLSLKSSAMAATFPLPAPDTGIVGSIQTVFSKREDTLLDIARRYDLGYNEIIAANPDVDPWLPGEHTRIVLPTQFVLPDAPHKGIVLNLAAMRLYYFPVLREGEQPVVKTYPIGIGRMNWETPIGVTRISSKEVNPVWHVPSSIRKEHAMQGETLPERVAAGPDNPLGRHALKLGIPGYLIHGTNKPYGVGRRVSHGCVRLYPEDIAELFRQADVNTPVRFVNQPYLAGWLNDNLYLEAHRLLADGRKTSANNLTPIVAAIMQQTRLRPTRVNWEQAIAVARQAQSLPVQIGVPAVPDKR